MHLGFNSKFWRKYWQHFVFWAVAFLFSFSYFWYKVGFNHAILRSVVNGIMVIGLVYINIIILIPWLFNRRYYLLYILVSIVYLISVTALRYYVDRWFLPTFPTMQFTGNEENIKWVVFYWAMSNFQFYVSLVYSLNLDLTREKQLKAELERQRLEAELKFLKSQLQPHFLLNTLNNIYTLTYLKNPLATPMLMKLSDSLKYLLYEGNTAYVPLQEEVRFIENYVELNKLRLDKPEKIHFSAEGILPNQMIQPLIFLAFIENAFKHSDTDENPNGFVRIKLVSNPAGKLVFYCTNTVHASKTNLEEKSGIGMVNVRQRLDILFEKNYRLDVSESNGVFNVQLEILLG